MKKEIYRVTVVREATMYCLAENTEDAMRVAMMFADELDNEDFEESGNIVDSCETYPTDIEDIDDDEEIIYKENGPVRLGKLIHTYADDMDDDWIDKIKWQDGEWLFPQDELKKLEKNK